MGYKIDILNVVILIECQLLMQNDGSDIYIQIITCEKSKKTVQILTPRKFGTAQMSFLAALVFAEKISGGARFCREKGQVWDTGFIIIYYYY